jgi:hypothetical protein
MSTHKETEASRPTVIPAASLRSESTSVHTLRAAATTAWP